MKFSKSLCTLGLFLFVFLSFTYSFNLAEDITIVASGNCGKNITWDLSNDGTLRITGTGEMQKYTSSSSVPWFSYNSLIKIVELNGNLSSISDFAFSSCFNLTSITIPDSVTYIGNYAFYGCNRLLNINIPNKVAFVGSHAFYSCISISNIELPENVINIGEYTFYNCNTLSSITLSDNITSIGNYAFYNCSNLNRIIIPDSVAYIGKSAFEGCSKLTHITLPNTVTTINDSTFCGCTALMNIDLPCSIISIGNYAFSGCNSLNNITLPNSINEVGSYAFSNCSSLKDIIIPNSIKSLGTAFSGCSGLISISIPDGVTAIERLAFQGCTSLKNIIIPNSVTSIDSYAFQGCTNLTNICIPNSVTSIGTAAFSYCSNLVSISIPDSVRNISASAFSNCTNLTSIEIPNSISSIDGSVFSNCSSLTNITIPDSVTSIGSYAFSNCNKLISINIPDSVTSIRSHAFEDCNSLTNIVIPNSISSISDSTFYNCSNLVSVTLPNSITSIGNSAFYGCQNIHIIFSGTKLPTIGSKVFSYNTYNNYKPIIYCYEFSEIDFWATDNEYPVFYLDRLEDNSPSKIILPKYFEMNQSDVCTVIPIAIPITENLSITWTSSAPEIVTVNDGGILTAVSSGIATITATCNNISTTMIVTVFIPVESFELSTNEIWLTSKETKQLFLKSIVPSNATSTYIWESSDTSIFSVSDDGMITTKMPGEAILTVTSDNGISRYCTVHVCYPVTEIEFDFTEYTIVSGKRLQLIANVKTHTQNYINRLITFTSSNKKIVDIDAEGVITAISYGIAEITAVSNNGVTSTCFINVICDNHMEAHDQAVAPTCIETGLTEGTHCLRCGIIITCQEVIPPLGHAIIIENALYETAENEKQITIKAMVTCEHHNSILLHWRSSSKEKLELIRSEYSEGLFSALFSIKSAGIAVVTAYDPNTENSINSCNVIIHSDTKLFLPASLIQINEEAFAHSSTVEVILPEGLRTIEARAFADCANLMLITLPDSLTNIAVNAFEGSDNIVVFCSKNSYAHNFSETQQIPYILK